MFIDPAFSFRHVLSASYRSRSDSQRAFHIHIGYDRLPIFLQRLVCKHDRPAFLFRDKLLINIQHIYPIHKAIYHFLIHITEFGIDSYLEKLDFHS